MNKVLIIAEAGVNHNGNMQLAKELVNVAAEAGADIVKFQSSKLDKLVSKSAMQAEYQKINTGDVYLTQYEMVKNLVLNIDNAKILKDYCDERGVKFLSTPFDIDSIKELVDFGLIDVIKIPSGEVINLPYLRQIARINLPVIISTGMCKMSEIAIALDILTSKGKSKDEITVLHCNTEYPTHMNDVNLKAMLTIRDAFKVRVGYSDHTLGIEVPIAAVSLGAQVIEKHFTIDRNLPGPDHKASLEPDELKNMVSSIRNIEKAISGEGIKKPSKSEIKNINIVRKSLHTTRALIKGHILSEDDIIPLRPGTGISPMDWDLIIGLRINKNLKEEQVITYKDIC